MKIRSRKLNSSNEFTIHSEKFSKDDCRKFYGTPYTKLGDFTPSWDYPPRLKRMLESFESNLDSIQVCEEFYQRVKNSVISYGLYSPNNDSNYIPYALVVIIPPGDGDVIDIDLKSMYDEVKEGKVTNSWSGEFLILKSYGPYKASWNEFQKLVGKNLPSRDGLREWNSKIADKWIEVEDILLLRNPDMTDDQLNKAIRELEVESNGDFNKAKRLASESNRKLNSSNEFTIHGVKFSKDNCHPRDFIPKTAFNEIPTELNYQLRIEKAIRNMGPNLNSIQMCEEFSMKYDHDAMVEYGLYSPNGDGNYIPYAVVVCYQPNGNRFCCDLKSVYDEMNGGKPHKWSGDFREWKSSDDWTLSQYKKFISNNSVYRGRSNLKLNNKVNGPVDSDDSWKLEFKEMCAIDPSRFSSFDEFYELCEKRPDLCSDEDLMEIDKKYQDLYRR